MPRAAVWKDRKGYKHPSTNPKFRKRYQLFRADYLRRNPLCAMCGRAANQLDHIEPLKNFSEVTFEQLCSPSNVQGLCFKCHCAKTSMENQKTRPPDFCLCGLPYLDGKPRCAEEECRDRWISTRLDRVGHHD